MVVETKVLESEAKQSHLVQLLLLIKPYIIKQAGPPKLFGSKSQLAIL